MDLQVKYYKNLKKFILNDLEKIFYCKIYTLKLQVGYEAAKLASQ